MSVEVKTFRSRKALLAHSSGILQQALDGGAEATLVVPSTLWARRRKFQLMEAGLSGVDVLSFGNWIEGLWRLYGDGSPLVSGMQRAALARPLLAEILGSQPSHGLLSQFAAFLAECVALDPDTLPELEGSDRGVLAMVEEYRQQLAQRGWVEPAQAEAVLSTAGTLRGVIVAEEPDARCHHAMEFLRTGAEGAQVWVLQRDMLAEDLGGASAPETPAPGEAAEAAREPELAQLAGALYGRGCAVAPSGAVTAAESHGVHIEGEVLSALIERAHSQGVEYADTCVVFANAADSYPHVQMALARAHVPFECSFTLECARTQLGCAFGHVMELHGGGDDASLYQALSSLALSPYSGVEAGTARALQAYWRARATSTHEQRLEDLRSGFAQGNADAALTRAALEPLVELLDAPLAEAVRLMFSHARAVRGAGSKELIDDARVADALLDYLEAVESVGLEPVAADAAHVAVKLERSCALDGEGAVRLVGAADAALASCEHIVLANLDAVHHPMAGASGPFDMLLEKLGAPHVDSRALKERCLLLDALESAGSRFSFYRVCHDAQGAESCQSALWDELVAAYAPTPDAAVSAQLPQSLIDAGATVVLSEAQLFSHPAQDAGAQGEESKGGEVPNEGAQGDDGPDKGTPNEDAPGDGTLNEDGPDEGTPNEDALGKGVQVARGVLASRELWHHLAQEAAGDAIPFSPTALEDYYRCPYRWFASRRVGYNGMDNSFSASAQGNLAHGFFDAFYRALHKRSIPRVTPENLDEALDLAEQVFDAQVRKGLDKPRTGLFLRTELDRLACDEIKEQVFGLIRRDASFLPGFVPAHFELELGKGTGRMLTYAGVPVRGKVDRVDVDPAGRVVVIDYKLSKLSAGYGFESGVTMPQRIQTDIYALLVQRHFELLGIDLHVVGSVYRSYAGNMLRGVYAPDIDWGPDEVARPSLDALPSEDVRMGYDAYLAHVEETVAECVESLVAGDIAPRPRAKGVCEYCRALPFCPAREA